MMTNLEAQAANVADRLNDWRLRELVVTITEIYHKYEDDQRRPLVLIGNGRRGQKMAILAFNVYNGHHHDTAFDLLEELDSLVSGNDEDEDIIGQTFVFGNLTLESNDRRFSTEYGVDQNLVVGIYERNVRSLVLLADPSDPLTDLRRFEANEIVNIPQAFVHSIYYQSEWENSCRLVLDLSIGGFRFKAISYLWSYHYVKDVKSAWRPLVHRRYISITDATLLRHPFYAEQSLTIGLRKHAIIGVLERKNYPHLEFMLKASDYDGPFRPRLSYEF